jgi:hypothetical protein
MKTSRQFCRLVPLVWCPRFSVFRRIPLVVAALVACVAPVVAEADEAPAATPLEQFKNFISSPPIIQNLVFQQKAPMEGGARPLDGTFALSTKFDYFQAKYQPDGMLFRRLGQPEDATNFTTPNLLVSVSAHQHALVEPGRRLTAWDDRDPSAAGKTTSVFYTTHFALEPLREIMNLGVMQAGVGSIRWTGDKGVGTARPHNQSAPAEAPTAHRQPTRERSAGPATGSKPNARWITSAGSSRANWFPPATPRPPPCAFAMRLRA